MSIFGRMFAACGLALGLCLVLSGCMPKADPREEAQSRAAYDAISAGDVAKLQSLVSPKLRASVTADTVKRLRLSASTTKLERVSTVGVETVPTQFGEGTLVETEYDYVDDYHAVLRTIFVGGEIMLFDLHSETSAQLAREQAARQKIANTRNVVTGLQIAGYAIMLLAAVELLYSRPRGWGWWLLGVVIEFCRIGINPLTGGLAFVWVGVGFLGTGLGTSFNISQAGVTPLAFSVPIVAILSLAQCGKSIAYRRRVNRLKAQAAKASYVGEPPKTEPPGS